MKGDFYMIYNEKITLLRESDETKANPHKKYLEVHAVFTEDGEMRPESLTWEDGMVYEVDSIKDVARSASRKAGGTGIRYLCMIEGRPVELYYEENYRWFIAI